MYEDTIEIIRRMTDESTLKCPIEKAHKDKEWSTKHYTHQQRLSNMRQDENQNLGRTVMLWCVCGGGCSIFSSTGDTNRVSRFIKYVLQ